MKYLNGRVQFFAQGYGMQNHLKLVKLVVCSSEERLIKRARKNATATIATQYMPSTQCLQIFVHLSSYPLSRLRSLLSPRLTYQRQHKGGRNSKRICNNRSILDITRHTNARYAHLSPSTTTKRIALYTNDLLHLCHTE